MRSTDRSTFGSVRSTFLWFVRKEKTTPETFRRLARKAKSFDPKGIRMEEKFRKSDTRAIGKGTNVPMKDKKTMRKDMSLRRKDVPQPPGRAPRPPLE
jgi:hypothetical protein